MPILRSIHRALSRAKARFCPAFNVLLTDYQTGISKRGDPMVRRHLVNAANALLMHTQKWCPLEAWGVKLAKRQGMSKARVAVARKLAILMHRMWIDGKDFRWESVPKKELEGLALS